MKRKFIAGFLTVALFFALAASGFRIAPAEAADQFRPGQFRLRLSTVVSGNHNWIQMAEFMRRELAERTNGAVELSIFPGAQLGNDEATVDLMRLGTLDMVIAGATTAVAFVPQLQILSLWYLYDDRYQFDSVMVGGGQVFNYIQRQYDERNLGLVLLGLGNAGERNVYSNRRIHSLSDMSGVNMRTTAAPIEAQVWGSLGTLPVPMGFAEIYTAMQANLIQAFEVTLAAFEGASLYEVAPYLILTGHQFTPSHISASAITFNRLPEEIQQIIREVAEEAARLGSRLANEADDSLIDVLVAQHNMTVIEVDGDEFRAVLEPLHDEVAANVGGEELLNIIRNQIR